MVPYKDPIKICGRKEEWENMRFIVYFCIHKKDEKHHLAHTINESVDRHGNVITLVSY